MSTTTLRAFKPFKANATVNEAVDGAADTLALGTGVGVGTFQVRVANIGTQTIYIDFGTASTVAAVATSIPMLANTVEVFTVPNDVTHIAHIAGDVGSTVYVTVGEGL